MNAETQVIDLGFVNAYLLKAGEGFILVDTGIGQQWHRLETALLQAGALPNKLKLVIITHGDFDHTGNCAELQRKYRLKIAMHAGDAEMVRTGQHVKRQARGLLGKLFLWLGIRMGGNFRCFEPDVLLEDEQELIEYGLEARIIHTPGHTKGSIAILTTDERFFIGDTVSNQGKPESTPFIENQQELQKSMRLLKGAQARLVYPGHGKPFAFELLASVRE